jgi:hypothetical protein
VFLTYWLLGKENGMVVDIEASLSETDCEWEWEDTPSGVRRIHIRIGRLHLHMDGMTWAAIMQARKEFKAKQ